MKLLLPVLCVTSLFAAEAAAADYPDRPVRVVVPFSAGAITDTLARVISSRMAQGLGQQLIVDNRPGANGIIGGDLVAKATPDGYTIMLAAASLFSINKSLYSMPYNTSTAFAPITQLSNFNGVLIVNQALPAKSVKELIAYGKANPGKLKFASCGLGGTIHLSGELFKSMTGVDMVHIPYKICPQAYTEIIGGQTQLMFDGMPTAMPQVKAGRVRPLAVTSAARSPLLPDLPTIAEAGLAGYEVVGWNGFAAPVGTPRPVINKLNQEIVRVLRMAEVREQLLGMGAEVVGSSPEEFGRLIRSEEVRWGKLIRAAGIKAE